eukprot:TRINITY_DN365_c0_g1_i1.p1 TRINITY_DN365_c0_g1~~TRINITY_DN365_c0_g1_i1.p1  ORF type:complete len:168 (-),score=48.93 TRINITY_DN365_c0_g1_i1:137-640(-)
MRIIPSLISGSSSSSGTSGSSGSVNPILGGLSSSNVVEGCATLYVEGLPVDATEREVAHIFRPFPGFQSLRMFIKESKKNPQKCFVICFVEFDSKMQASVAMNLLQGYKIDQIDNKGIIISWAKSERIKPKSQVIMNRNPTNDRDYHNNNGNNNHNHHNNINSPTIA